MRDVLGLCHCGSAAAGGLKPDGDLDLLLVTRCRPELLRSAALGVVPDLVAEIEGDARNVLLTLARVLVSRARGV